MNAALPLHAPLSRGAAARPSKSPTRALCSLDRNQSSLSRPAKLRGNHHSLRTSSDQLSALPSSSRRFAASSRAQAIVARARAELKALIFDCDGTSIVRGREGGRKVVFFLRTPFLPHSSSFALCLSSDKTPTSFPSRFPPSRRHPRVRGPPPPRLQRNFCPLRPPLPRTGIERPGRVVRAFLRRPAE